MPPSALSGIRVLDISNFFAAPLVSSLLGDFGAEVIKVEPPQGDPYRQTHLWPLLARNKKSITLDFTTDEGCEAFRRLVATADVVVENLPSALLEQRGHDWATLSAINPRLIMLSLSCYGQTGPYAGRPGNGTLGEAFAGLTHLTGPADGAPVLPSVAIGDAVGALSAANGIVTALYWRDARGGTGQHIDATLYEPMLQAICQATANWKPGQPPRRLGNRLTDSQFRNVFRTGDDRYVVVALSTPRQLRGLRDLIGAAADADAEQIAALWIGERTRQEVLEIFAERGLLAVPANDLDDVFADRHVRARESLIRVDDPVYGPIALPGSFPALSATPGGLRWVAAPLGAHNAEVLGE